MASYPSKKKKKPATKSHRDNTPRHPLLGLPDGKRIWKTVVDYIERTMAPPPPKEVMPPLPIGGLIHDGCFGGFRGRNPDQYKVSHLAETLLPSLIDVLPEDQLAKSAFDIAQAFVDEEKKRFPPPPLPEECSAVQPEDPALNFQNPGVKCGLPAGHMPSNTHVAQLASGVMVDWADATPAFLQDEKLQGAGKETA